MRSYEEATESKTSFTSDSLLSSGTVRKPNEAVLGGDWEEEDDSELTYLAPAPKIDDGWNSRRAQRETDSITWQERTISTFAVKVERVWVSLSQRTSRAGRTFRSPILSSS